MTVSVTLGCNNVAITSISAKLISSKAGVMSSGEENRAEKIEGGNTKLEPQAATDTTPSKTTQTSDEAKPDQIMTVRKQASANLAFHSI